MLSSERILGMFLCLPFFTYLFLWSAIQHLFELGKSKTRIKKEKKDLPFVRKILLIGYVEKCKYHISTAKRLCFICWGYALFSFVCIGVWIISIITPGVEGIFSWCALARIFVLDIPVNVYSLIMTKHDKKIGGVTWRWKDKD